MGGFFETERMKKHVEQCAVCKAAHPEGGDIRHRDCCDEYSAMLNNVIDFECEEGPLEGGRDMCTKCDGPIEDGGFCTACMRDLVNSSKKVLAVMRSLPNGHLAILRNPASRAVTFLGRKQIEDNPWIYDAAISSGLGVIAFFSLTKAPGGFEVKISKTPWCPLSEGELQEACQAWVSGAGAVKRLGEQSDVKWEIGAKYEVLPAGRGKYGVVATLVRIGTVSTGHGDLKSGLIFRDDSGKRIEVATLSRVIRMVQ
jgi:hypothetical protein